MARHIYVHVPFCARKCPYCDFFSVTSSDYESYFKALNRQIKLFGELGIKDTNSSGADTVYFGGGTPSVPDSSLICSTLNNVIDTFNISSDAEITIEANPHSLTIDKAASYYAAGFNRVSLGVQSLQDSVLKTLGRLHDSAGAVNALGILTRAGFSNFSGDLITAVPGQSLHMLYEDADRLIDAGVKHISTYSLSIEEGTPFYKLYKDSIEDIVSPELEREMYHGLREKLSSAGINPYEISNNAYAGFESKHNSSYWEGFEYYGFGCGAHGYLNGVRYGHENDISGYIEGVRNSSIEELEALFFENKDNSWIFVEECLNSVAKMREYPYLKLRTTAGININEFNSRFNSDFLKVFAEPVKANVSKGLLEICDGNCRLTAKGLDWANQVFADFL